MTDLLSLLQTETGLELALTLPIKQIVDLCETNPEINTRYCQNDYFWRLRFNQDIASRFGVQPNPNLTWRKNYELYSSNEFYWLSENYFQPIYMIENVNYDPNTLNQIQQKIREFVSPPKLEPPISNILKLLNDYLYRIDLALNQTTDYFEEQMLAEESENVRSAINIINNLDSSEYLQRYSISEIKNMGHQDVIKFVNALNFHYVNDLAAKRRILRILRLLYALVVKCTCGGNRTIIHNIPIQNADEVPVTTVTCEDCHRRWRMATEDL